jgi:hypothetical protein
VPADPLITLASSLQAAPGTYALLLGSGVSRAAQVPTGWEVVTTLARRAATASEEDPGVDPIAWYAGRFGGTADYSRLLEELPVRTSGVQDGHLGGASNWPFANSATSSGPSSVELSQNAADWTFAAATITSGHSLR